jgi:adenosylcobinamide-GDP ribazoletransferase
MLRRQLVLFVCAVQFLTRLPTPALKTFDPDWTTRAARWFPLVGQIVGGLSALVLLLAGHVWPGAVAALLAIAASLIATGAFHEDGLADSFDGLWGGATPERRLEIMKDSRIGTYGAIALVVVLALKVASLAALPLALAAWSLLAGHGLARAAAVVCMKLTPYAPAAEAGKWKPAPKGVGGGEVLFAVLISLWPVALLPPAAAAVGGLTGGVLAAGMALVARRKLGGHTGDVLGAVEQMFELGFLFGVAAVLG